MKLYAVSKQSEGRRVWYSFLNGLWTGSELRLGHLTEDEQAAKFVADVFIDKDSNLMEFDLNENRLDNPDEGSDRVPFVCSFGDCPHRRASQEVCAVGRGTVAGSVEGSGFMPGIIG